MTHPVRLIRVLVVDDHPALAAGLVGALEASGSFELVGIAGSLAVARRQLAELRPDLVVCDRELPDGDGIAFVREVGPSGPPIVILSAPAAPAFVRRALEAGAAGYLSKTDTLDRIVTALRRAAEGEAVFRAADLRAAQGALRQPSPREIQVLGELSAGRSNADLAARLGISGRTVESHLRRLFERYDVANRTELVMLALAEGWIRIG